MVKQPTNTADEVPPGATKQALDRPLNPAGGPPGSGAGPRHGADDNGSENEAFGRDDPHHTVDAEADEEAEQEPAEAYGGPSGGAVGGSPAGGRSTGGRAPSGGIAPGGSHRGDSTIGGNPDQPTD